MYVDVPSPGSPDTSLARLDEVHAEAGRIDRLRLRAIYEADKAGAWRGEGHRDHASLLAARYGYSLWKARRMVAAAFAIEGLPITSLALERGHIGLDKVIDLTRFATAATEADLVAWATRVRSGAVRERADAACRARDDAERVQRSRSLTWSWEDSGSVLSLQGQLPAEGGRRFVEAVDRLARELPAEPEYDTDLDDESLDERRADALILLTTASETGGERSTVVVHASMDALRTGDGVAELAGRSSIAASTAQRIACDSKIEVVLYGAEGETVGIGRAAHDPPAWLRRQVMKRDDHSCSFPGCAMKRYLNIHHIEWWHEGGKTDLDNLLTLCHFHHKLVHEYGWRVQLAPDGAKTWFRPGGTPYEPASVPELPPEPPDDDIPWGSLWHALKGEQPVEEDGFVRWSWKRGVDWIPSRT